MKKIVLIILFAAVVAGGFYAWRVEHPSKTAGNEILLYGNVDLRQVNLAFNGNERIETLPVKEGDRVKKGQVLGTLEQERLKFGVDRAEAHVQSQRHIVERLEHGSRPEEIEQARANVQATQTDLDNAEKNFERLKHSTASGASSRQDLDNAKTAMDVARARLLVNRKALELAVLGPRKEDKAEARATLRFNEADLALQRKALEDATLVAPSDGVVRNRILEPGEMASPQRPVLALALTDPKWVRAYIPEPDLGKIRHGMKAVVTTDSFPGKQYEGWVGFISPMAEFTPKSVETTELRTALVYEVRIFVTDPGDELRLGMPATVQVSLSQPAETQKEKTAGSGA